MSPNQVVYGLIPLPIYYYVKNKFLIIFLKKQIYISNITISVILISKKLTNYLNWRYLDLKFWIFSYTRIILLFSLNGSPTKVNKLHIFLKKGFIFSARWIFERFLIIRAISSREFLSSSFRAISSSFTKIEPSIFEQKSVTKSPNTYESESCKIIGLIVIRLVDIIYLISFRIWIDRPNNFRLKASRNLVT